MNQNLDHQDKFSDDSTKKLKKRGRKKKVKDESAENSTKSKHKYKE